MKRLMGLGLGFLLIFGCGGKTYWMVNDLNTNNVYYTQGINNLSGGAVIFTDAQTGNRVTLQNHGEKKMTEEEFKAAVGNVEKKSAEEKEMNGYALFKGGYFFPSGEFQRESMNGNTYWELAGGLDFLRFFGIELGVGHLQAQNSKIDVYSVPVLLSGKVQFPIDIQKNLDHLLFFVPYLKAGGVLLCRRQFENWPGVGFDLGLGIPGWGWHRFLGGSDDSRNRGEIPGRGRQS